MTQSKMVAIRFALCSTLAACNGAERRDLTGPGAVTSEISGIRESTSQVAAGNTWSTEESLSPWRRSMAAATINDIIYVVGGVRRDGTALARVDAYDVATGTWSTVSALPGARVNPNGASVIKGRLYVSGGWNRDNRSTKTLFVYDPETDTWTRKADVPQPGCGGAQGVIADQLYVYTGCYTSSAMSVFFRYNPATNAWVTLAAPPTAHKGGVARAIDGKLYLAGGLELLNSGGNEPNEYEAVSDALHVYNPATNTWSARAPMPSLRSNMSAGVLNGKLYLAGGTGDGLVGTVEAYNPMTNTWAAKAPLPVPTAYGAITTARGKLFFVAGYDSRLRGPSQVYAYTP
jgi:N-acetylneuraminic acid mutarotase